MKKDMARGPRLGPTALNIQGLGRTTSTMGRESIGTLTAQSTTEIGSTARIVDTESTPILTGQSTKATGKTTKETAMVKSSPLKERLTVVSI